MISREDRENFFQRLFLGTILAIIVIFILFVSHTFGLSLLFLAATLIGMNACLCEWNALFPTKLGQKEKVTTFVFANALLIFSFFSWIHSMAGAGLFFYLFFVALFLSRFSNPVQSMSSLSGSALGFVFIALPFCLLIKINYAFIDTTSSHPSLWTFFLIFATKATDIGGYFIGKKFGKRPLAPALSPKKTIAGLVGGYIASLIVAYIFSQHADIPSISQLEWLLLGFGIATAAVFGDLAESVLKRDAGAKNSNTQYAFGGALDLYDSLLGSTPLLYLYLTMKFAA